MQRTAFLLLALGLTAAMALAGCSGGSGGGDGGPTDSRLGEGEGPGNLNGDFDEIEVTDDTGGIRGVVVDQSYQPVTEAAIEVAGVGVDTATDANGEFVVTGLAEGTYIVTASHPLYDSVQQNVDVRAGDKTPDPVRFQLEREVFTDPYTTTLKFRGFIACSAGVPAVGYSEECGEGVGVPCGVPAIGCQRIGGQDNNLVQYDFSVDGPDVKTLVVEQVWEPSTGGVASGQLYTVVATDWVCDPFCSGNELGSQTGAAPFYIRVEPEVLEPMNLTADVTITAFSWANAEQPNLILNQDYELFVTSFYALPAPEGWSFVAGDQEPF